MDINRKGNVRDKGVIVVGSVCWVEFYINIVYFYKLG